MKKISRNSPNYPQNLKNIKGMPKQLFIKGEILPQDSLAVAIVGSRETSKYGREMAYEFAYQLAKNNVTIISGLARGIDTVAHKAALAASGRTIAVLANALDSIYPPENKSLAEKVITSGALVSEFPPGTKITPKFFLARNRLISALARAVLVIEGRQRSGTLSTATHAANQGREVFALPGPPSSPLSAAPLYLLENGAFAATSPQDILDAVR